MFLTRLLIASCVATVAFAVHAEPVPDAERVPVDLRRTTLVVRDIDASLPLYRDALGLTVIYDQHIPGQGADGKPSPGLRLVLLRANDTFIGALGLMQRLGETHPPRQPNARAVAGQPILVFNAKDLGTRFEAIEATPNIEIATRPVRIDYPAPDGGKIPVLFSAVYDPDGFFIEINQLLGAPAGTPASPAHHRDADDDSRTD